MQRVNLKCYNRAVAKASKDLDIDESSPLIYKDNVNILYDKNGIFNKFKNNSSIERKHVLNNQK